MNRPHPREFAPFLAGNGEPLLNDDARCHLWRSTVLLRDEITYMVTKAAEEHRLPWDTESPDAVLGFQDYLPSTLLHRCTWQTIHDFVHALDAVIIKLGHGPCHAHMLSTHMEEFAMRAVIERGMFEIVVAADLPDDFGLGYDIANVHENDIEALRDAAFEDDDHDMLFRPELDGIENDEEMSTKLGFDLRPAAWTKPFANAPDNGHPLSWAMS